MTTVLAAGPTPACADPQAAAIAGTAGSGPSRPGPFAVRVCHVDKYFGSLQALRDISFDVANGEVVALLGASGCGKSTLLNIVSGLDHADAGHLDIAGVPATHFRDWRRMAYLFQEDRLLPWRSVLDNVMLGLEVLPVARAERAERARATLALVGLSGFEASWPHQLSGGMRSRAALARSLVTEPQILLMDEPFSKLDPQTRGQMHEELLRIQQIQKTTILFVTHDVEEAVVLADRIVLLDPRPGRVREIVNVDLPRPRPPTDPDVAERTRQLRLKVHQ